MPNTPLSLLTATTNHRTNPCRLPDFFYFVNPIITDTGPGQSHISWRCYSSNGDHLPSLALLSSVSSCSWRRSFQIILFYKLVYVIYLRIIRTFVLFNLARWPMDLYIRSIGGKWHHRWARLWPKTTYKSTW